MGQRHLSERGSEFNRASTRVDNRAMPTSWHSALLDRLLSTAHDAGGWGYAAGRSFCAEPTCLASIALAKQNVDSAVVRRALDRLVGAQPADGCVPVMDADDAPCWTTALAILSWTLAGSEQVERYRPALDKARHWLLHARGLAIPDNPTVYGHNPSLIGWSWVRDTHSWVEPTGYAVLALRALEQSDHPRVREAIQLLLDRAIPGGGWNYGNSRVFQNTLRPFPGTTGVALAALAGEPIEPRIRAGLDYLASELPTIRAPMSLAWGVMGLTAWGHRPPEASAWLGECAQRCLRETPNPLYDALLLLADLEECPLTSVHRVAEMTHG